MSTPATAIGATFAVAATVAVRFKVGHHFDRKLQKARVRSVMFRRTGNEVTRVTRLIIPSFGWPFKSRRKSHGSSRLLQACQIPFRFCLVRHLARLRKWGAPFNEGHSLRHVALWYPRVCPIIVYSVRTVKKGNLSEVCLQISDKRQ